MNNKPKPVPAAHNWIQKGRGVWILATKQYPNPNQDAFLQGEVIDIGGHQVVVQLKQAQKQFKINMNNIQKLTYGPHDVPDMVDLEELNQPQLLYNIKRRYLSDVIFTYCGPTLLIINPYAYIEKLFNDTVMQQFQTLVFTQTLQYKNLSPHIFALAAFCLWQLFDNQRNQSIVISGQSGAGKTQNTKYCLKFLASLGKNMKDLVMDKGNKKINYQQIRSAQKAIKKADSNKLFGIQDRILGCNQILQAFGNAKTIRNDNSSRFGKLILLLYGDTPIDIKSALITSYLLQKSRIVSVADGQRNYHVFYYFCKGTSAQQKQKFKLKSANNYYYLNQSSTYQINGKDDSILYELIKKQFQLYLSQEEIQCVLKIISSVLNTGNLQFQKGQTANHQECASITNQQFLKNVCQLLSLNFQKFKHALKFKTRKLGMSYIDSPLKYDQAIALRDSFSKNVYEKTFNFLVEKLNEKIQIEKIDLQNQTKSSRALRKSIGLLDIFGFQVLGINTLQQFFINFANEKLQQLYVSYIFKQQQNQFLREGLQQFSIDIGFQDNKPVIDLFELYPLGIFHLINQSSELNKPDQQLPQAIQRSHPRNQFVLIPMSKKGHFQINHSCSPVMYNTQSFTAKNKDQFPQQLLDLIEDSKDQVVKNIIIGEVKKQIQQTGKGKASKKFLGSKFLSQMNKLTDQLYSCDCHFVRCIKPNSKKAPKTFNSQAVLQSLRYLGVLDSIKIRKLGYIYRRPYKQFHKKFFELQQYIFSYPVKVKNMTQDDFKQESKKYVVKYVKKQLEQKNILFGTKKILIKQSTLNLIQLLTKQKRKLRIQVANRTKEAYKKAVFRKCVNQWLGRLRLLKEHMKTLADQTRKNILKKKAIMLQVAIRKFIWAKRYEKIKQQGAKSVTKIASYWRMKIQRKKFLAIRQKVIKLQSVCRAYMQVGHFLRTQTCRQIVYQYFEETWHQIQTKKATIIQKVWRGYKTRKVNKKSIATMKIVLALSKLNNNAKKTAVRSTFRRFEQLIQKIKKPILKLQAIVKRRYCERVYQKIRKSAILIQKTYRKHLAKKFYLNRLWNKYKEHLSLSQINKFKQLCALGGRGIQTKSKNIDETIGIPTKLYPNQLLQRYIIDRRQELPMIEEVLNSDQDYRINEIFSFTEKNTMQAFVADYDMMSDGDNQGKWMKNFANLRNQLNKKNEYPLNISICQGFTTVLTNRQRLYCISAQQENQQISYINKLEMQGNPQKLVVTQDSGYLLSSDNKVYIWGDNKNGQLFNNNKKQLVVAFKENLKLNNVIQISAKGSNKYFVTKDYKLYESNGFQKPKILEINDKVTISSIAASYSFVHFLTTSGNIYSKGNNIYGQLGLGFSSNKSVQRPTLNTFLKLKKQMIQSVSVGIAHTVVKTKLGYAYAWGDNSFRQVSSQEGKYHYQQTPIIIQIEKQKAKVLQAVAGARISYFLLQNMKIIANGASSCISVQKYAQNQIIDLLSQTVSNSKNLVPIKLNTTWTRTSSLLTVNAIDQTKCKNGAKPDVILKYCKTIAKQWLQNSIYPNYHQWMDNILHISDMRKFKFANQLSPKKGKNPFQPENDLDQLKILMQLRKTSTLFRQAAKKKIDELQKRLQYKSKNDWNQQDLQTFKYIKQYCLNALR